MGKIVNLRKNQRRKLHQMTLDTGEKVLTMWIDGEVAKQYAKIDGVTLYQLPSGQYFISIDEVDKARAGVLNQSINDTDTTVQSDNESANEQAPNTRTKYSSRKPNNLDISDLL